MQCAPAAYADIQRYEADSKFFRSLAVVLPLLGAAAPLIDTKLWWVAPTAFALTYFSLLSYAERRHKSTEWAYRHAIVLQTLPAARPGSPVID